MKKVRIKRFNDSGKEVLGAVFINNSPVCLSLEQPWNDNKVSASCIPVGEYVCKWHDSPKYGWCYTVTNVEGRSHILFHAGNTADDTRGCILLGSSLNVMRGLNAVSNSRMSVANFNGILGKESFKLTIE